MTVELEPEWATMHPETLVGDAFVTMDDWYSVGTRFDGIVTSPVYGNRMSDHHKASDPSKRRSYTHDLGRELSEGNSGTMYFWNDDYKLFHRRAWAYAYRITRPGGWMFLNVSNFLRTTRTRSKVGGVNTIKRQAVQFVVPWHMKMLQEIGYKITELVQVGTPRMRHGENHEARVDCEHIIVAKKPGGSP